MNRLFHTAAFALSALAVVVTPILASADVKADVARLRTSRTAERYEVEVPGASIKAGGAQVFVNAPLAAVRQVVTDYAHYQDFMPRFERSRVVRRTRDFSDVYLQVPILHGAATVWAVTRFNKPVKQADGSETIEGVMTDQSNVSDFRATYRLIPVDEQHTLLKAELLIVPKLPLPGSMVTPELAFAADKAVTASRDRAEAASVRVAAGAPTTP
jgi:ribosome-associated toxin RatA of RatAB toxin-antitoxin module